jgi:integrase
MDRRKTTKLPKGIKLHGGMIRIDFTYNKRRYRKSVGLPDTKDNIALANAMLLQMRAQNTMGTLNITDYFPSSASDEENSLTTTRLGVLVANECERKHKIGIWGDSTYEHRMVAFVKHFEPAFGMLTMPELTPTHVRLWLKEQTFSSDYACQVLSLMRGLFDSAVGDGFIKRHPFSHIKTREYLKTTPTHQRKKLINPLTFEEIQMVIDNAPEQEKAFWGVGFFTGMRLQELLCLRWEDVDWDMETIHIQRAVKRHANGEEYIAETKNDESDRIIEVDAEVMLHLRNHRQFTQLEGTFIFKPTIIYNRPKEIRRPEDIKRKFFGDRDRYGFTQVKEMWPKALNRAGVSLTNRSPKQIRHTYASLMLSEGMNPMQIANTMGHTSLSMLEKHYAKAIMRGKHKRRHLDISTMLKESLSN